MKPHLLISAISLLLSVTVVAQTPATQQGVGQQKPLAHWFTKDMTVYVSDFELDAQNVQADQGSMVSQVRPGNSGEAGKEGAKRPGSSGEEIGG
jgi:hypothetical protein